jgi:hypothetical protein
MAPGFGLAMTVALLLTATAPALAQPYDLAVGAGCVFEK